MATVTQPTPPPAPRTESRDGYQRYIEEQLERTSSQVKLNDLFGASMLLIAGILSFFLAVAIIDHWVYGLGAFGRWLALAVLVAGSGFYFIRVILPLIVGRINPVYAARMIERSEP